MAKANLDEIRLHIREELIPDQRENGKYLCPLCLSGFQPGGDHDGAFSVNRDGVHGKCFSCGFYGDIFDLVSKRDGISLQAATKALVEKYGSSPLVVHTVQPRKPEPEIKHDFSAELKECAKRLPGSPGEQYLRKRGFSDESIARFSLGYTPSHYFPDERSSSPAIIGSYDSKGSYVFWRSISDKRTYDKPAKDKAGSEPVFNAEVLYAGGPVFVVESQFCAISIEQIGGHAVAIGGTGHDKLIKQLAKKPASGMLILSLDNDSIGKEKQSILAKTLSEKGIPFIEFLVSGDSCKDPNELLQKDPSALRDRIAEGLTRASTAMADLKNEEESERESYENRTASASFADFEAYLKANASRPPIPTGFSSLDKILNGGLTPSLYIMGAISSLGKTSWMLNIADNIASAGNDVLYFSLEMSRYELMAKSISRISFRRIGEQELSESEAFSTFGVLNSASFRLSDDQSSALRAAMDIYRDTIGKHMWIRSGVSNISTDDITQAVEEHIRITGRKPVVFVDYLQILAPEDPHLSDKQNTDRAVVKLKNLSSSHDIPVFCISSLNRNNYSEPINMAAFKESGAIEYGSDVLIGLQLYGIDYVTGEKDTERKVRVSKIVDKAENDPQTEIEVKVLKNRNGCRGGSGCLLFDKKYNSFSEVPSGYKPASVRTPFDDDEIVTMRR